jgi:YD repeat-containing protein
MKRNPLITPRPSRRDILTALPALACACRLVSELHAAETLYELKRDDLERLKLDFNANRNKTRLVFVLSPT